MIVKQKYALKSDDTFNLSRNSSHTSYFKKDKLLIRYVDEPDGDESPGLDYIEIKNNDKVVFEAYNYSVAGYIPGEWEKQIESLYRAAQKYDRQEKKEQEKIKESQKKAEQKEKLSRWGL